MVMSQGADGTVPVEPCVVAQLPGDLAERVAFECDAARRGHDQVHVPLLVRHAGAVLPVVGDLEGADDIAGTGVAGIGSVAETRFETGTVTTSGVVWP